MKPTEIDGDKTTNVDRVYIRNILIEALGNAQQVTRVDLEQGGIYLETSEREGVRCFLIHLEVKRL